MSISLRYYLFPTDGEPLRLSQRLVEGLVYGKDAMPQYANSEQRVICVVLRNDNRQPTKITRTSGEIWTFDSKGEIREGLMQGAFEVMNLASETSSSMTSGTVVSIRPQLNKKKLAEKYRWQPSNVDIDRINRDIWPKLKTDRLKEAKGTSQRRPPLTSEAKYALSEMTDGFWKFATKMNELTEPGLKGIAFELREKASQFREFKHLYNALANMADDQLELLRRKRSGKGIWYANVEVTYWREEREGDVVESFHQRCEGRPAAVDAARRMFVENAHKFSENRTVSAEVLTDIEWEAGGYGD
jgi:hypothetical protein